MDKKITSIVFLGLVSAIFLSSTFLLSTDSNYNNNAINAKNYPINTLGTYHAPINITNNSELAMISISGNGSKINPYIITNFIINPCTANHTGVNVQNTNKYFIFSNIVVSGCSIGFSFTNVTYGSIIESYVINYTFGIKLAYSTEISLLGNSVINASVSYFSDVAFFLFHSSINTVTNNLVVNTYTGIALAQQSNYNIISDNRASGAGYAGFSIYNASNNRLLSNLAYDNAPYGYRVQANADNNILINNTAIDNGNGFSLSQSNNIILEKNIGVYNGIDFDQNFNCANTSLINNEFVFMSMNGNNMLVYSGSMAIFNNNTIIALTILCFIYGGIEFYFYISKKKNLHFENPIELQPGARDFFDIHEVGLSAFLGIIDVILVILTLLPSTLFINVSFGPYLFGSSNTFIFQESPLSGILLFSGAILTLMSVILFFFTKFDNKSKIPEYFSLSGLLVQTLGIILLLVTYVDIINAINAYTRTVTIVGTTRYSVEFNFLLTIALLGVELFALSTYLYQNYVKNNKPKKIS